MTVHDILATSVGQLLLVANDEGLTTVQFGTARYAVPPLDDWVPVARGEGPAKAIVLEARAQLEAYFAGRLSQFTLPLAGRGTPFQQRVWRELRSVPFGETVSYGDLARSIGAPAAVRAVGGANARNPIPIIVPCHRVVGSTRIVDRLRGRHRPEAVAAPARGGVPPADAGARLAWRDHRDYHALRARYAFSGGRMTRYDYLIVGGGMTADAAAHGIREQDTKGTIGIIGAEPHRAVQPPPAHQGALEGRRRWTASGARPRRPGPSCILGRRIVIARPARQARDRRQRDASYEYGKLLLATGGRPRRLPDAPDGVIYFRTLEDYRRLRGTCRPGRAASW